MKKILLVEDDPNLGLLLQDYLQLKGKFDVVLCKDGDEGLRTFTRHTFDLLILDVMMPKKDGVTLGKDIRKINAHVPIIFATAKGMIVFAASGDNDSSDGGSSPANVDVPSSCPHVIGCGGTTKTRTAEVVWNHNSDTTSGEGTGGGY